MSLLFNTFRQEESFPSAKQTLPYASLSGRISRPLWWAGVAFLAGLFPAILLLSRHFNVEPYVPLLALCAVVATIAFTRKFTGALVAGLLYVGNFKTTAAVGINPTDPTFIVLVLCAAGLLIECLFVFSRPDEGSILALFEGQARGVLLFLLFLGVIAMSELYTVAPESGLLKLQRIAVFCVLVFFAPFILFKKRKDVDQFLITAIFLSLLLSLRNVLDLFHPTTGILTGNEDITRIGDGELIGTTLLVLVYHRFSGKWPRLRLVCIALLSIGLIASAARSAALSVLIAMILTSLLLRRQRNRERSGRLVLGLAIAAIIAAGAILWIQQLPSAQAKIGYKFNELDTLMHGRFLPGGTAEQRMNFYKQSLVAIGERPFLGWGVAGWGVFFLGTDQKAIPHDFVLEAAVEQGLVGCAILLGFLLTAWSALRKTVLRAGSYFVFLLPVFLFAIISNLVTGDLESRLLWFWCGTIFALTRLIRQQWRTQRYQYASSTALR